MGTADMLRRSLGELLAKLAVVGESRGIVEEIRGENVEFSRIVGEIADHVEKRRAIVGEARVSVEGMDLKSEEIAESVDPNGRPPRKAGLVLKEIKTPLKEILSALEKWRAPLRKLEAPASGGDNFLAAFCRRNQPRKLGFCLMDGDLHDGGNLAR